MNRTILISLICLIHIHCFGNSPLHFKLTKIVSNGTSQTTAAEYLFINLTESGCFDCDYEGFTVGNGFLNKINVSTDYIHFAGFSEVFGNCIYIINKDGSTLNIRIDSENKVYVYKKCTPPKEIRTCSRLKSSQARPDANSVQPTVLPNIVDSPKCKIVTIKKQCRICNGAGRIKRYIEFASADYYKYCDECGAIMQYNPHIHQDCSVCYGRGYIEEQKYLYE